MRVNIFIYIFFINNISCNYLHSTWVDNYYEEPINIMVDVTNKLGVNILHSHSFLNENNIAFSPCGLTSVLIALYEGSDGHTAVELYEALGLPWERDLVRIGYRDVHRRLRSYFIPSESFLSGLSLNSDNVTFRDEYKSILKFYGYDYETNLKNPTVESASTDEPEIDEVTVTSVTVSETATEILSVVQTTAAPDTTVESSTSKMDEVTVTSVTVSEIATEILSVVQTTATPDTTVESSTSKMDEVTAKTEISTESSTVMSSETTILPEESSTSEITTIIPEPTSVTSFKTETPETESPVPKPEVSQQKETTTSPPPYETETNIPTSSESNFVTTDFPISSEKNEDAEYQNYSDFPENFAAAQSTEEPNYINNLADSTTIFTDISSTAQDIESETTTNFDDSSTNFLSTDFVSESTTDSPDLNIAKRSVSASRGHYINPGHHHPLVPENQTMVLPFFVDPYEIVTTEFMSYCQMLPFTFLPNLHAAALQLELDSDKYHLLIILPEDGYHIDVLVHNMRQQNSPSLREIQRQLRDTFVKAAIPNFMVNGFITLTSDLQKMGIRSVFEPSYADFSPMTTEKNIYVTNIEQAVTVSIKTHSSTDARSRNIPYNAGPPVEFFANRPFVFFVVDSEINVALVIGRVINPINSRLQ